MEFLTSLALLACPVGMGLMMWFMMKGMNGGQQRQQQPATPSADALRAERLRIDAELARREADDALAAERA